MYRPPPRPTCPPDRSGARSIPTAAAAALWTLAACAVAPDPSADSAGPVADSAADTDTDTDTAPPPLLDRDSDGWTEDVDCDDRDPRIRPDATESWNEVDDDCDGHADADGSWVGSVTLVASAVHEGVRRDFRLACPVVGTRTEGALDFTVTCSPDAADPYAQLLLGATFTIRPEDGRVDGPSWSDHATFASSNGWDSRGDGAVQWSTMDAASVVLSMSGVSLAAEARGDLSRSTTTRRPAR